MVLINPVGVQAQGNVSIFAVLAVANPSAPTLTELNATTGLNLSCFLFEGSGGTSVEQNKVDSARRLCSTDTFERLGNKKYTMEDLMYAYDPQALDNADANKAKALLVAGTRIYLARRLGKDAKANDTWSAGERGELRYVQLGEQDEQADTSNESNEIQIRQTVSVLSKPTKFTVPSA